MRCFLPTALLWALALTISAAPQQQPLRALVGATFTAHVVSVADDLEPVFGREEHPQPLPGQRLIVNDQRTDARGFSVGHATRVAASVTTGSAALNGIRIRTVSPFSRSANSRR